MGGNARGVSATPHFFEEDFHERQIQLGLGDPAAHAQKIRDVTRANKEAQDEAADRIKKQISLIQSGADDRTVALELAAQDAIYKKRQDILKIDQEIAAQRAKLAPGAG